MWQLNRGALFAVFLLGTLAVAAVLGCNQVDEVTPPPGGTVTATPQPISSSTVTASPSPVPTQSSNDDRKQAGVTLSSVRPCAVGLTLDPGEACVYADGVESDFFLGVRPDGQTILEGSVGTLESASRVADPGEKLCTCGLSTEVEGLSRTITSLPKPFPNVEVREFRPPPSPYLDPQVKALVDAIEGENLPEIENLIAAGVDVDARAGGGRPMLSRAMSVALRTGNLEFMNVFIDAGANVNAFDDYGDPLVRKAFNTGSEDVLRRLLDAGADPTIGKENRSTVLHEAAWIGRLDALKIFLDEYTEPGTVNQFDNPLLGSAIARENMEMIEYLLDAGANLHARYSDGRPLLARTFWNDSNETLQFLLDKGLDPNDPDGTGLPAWWELLWGGSEIVHRLDLLFEEGADPNSCDHDGNALLFSAIGQNKVYMVAAVLRGGADINALNAEGKTALEFARDGGRPADIIQYLIDAGAE